MAADPISVAGPAFIVGLIFFRTRRGDHAALVGTTSVAGFRFAAPPHCYFPQPLESKRAAFARPAGKKFVRDEKTLPARNTLEFSTAHEDSVRIRCSRPEPRRMHPRFGEHRSH